MQSTDIRSNALSLQIREKKYILKHVESVDTTQKHLSSTVNVVCAQVTTTPTTTTTTSQAMWDSTHHAAGHDDSCSDNEDLDILTASSLSEEEIEEKTTVTTGPSDLFQFHFEFGSKRPPSTTVTNDLSSSEEEEEEEGSLSESEDHGWALDDSRYFPAATEEALATYENITANIYIGSATGRSMAEESMPCECKYDSELDPPLDACGDDNRCINRMMFMECMVQDCPCGRLCRNRRFQLGQYAPVDVIKTQKKGFGLRALTNLPPNSFIMEYMGEVIPQKVFLERTREYDAEGYTHYYFMTLKNDEIIDATKRGCLARFMNHSCHPNCVTQKWVIGKKMRIGIFTSRFITAGEELTFDYKFERYGTVAQACYCGEFNCKGYIGASDSHKDHVFEHVKVFSSSSSESDDSEEVVKQVRQLQPLQDPNTVQSFVKRMLNSVGKPRLVNKLLMRLKMTNADNSHGREILKMIVRLHGLKMLKFWLGEWKSNETIVLRVLQVLEKLPLANRNGLEDCQLFDVVQRCVGHDNEEISQLSEHLLASWSELKSVYRIPKRVQTTADKTNKTKKRYKKRTRYESSRELFDPDNDYLEYIPMNATYEDMAFKLQFSPSIKKNKQEAHTPSQPPSVYPFYPTYHPSTDYTYYPSTDYTYYPSTDYTYYYYPTETEDYASHSWQTAVTEQGVVYYYNLLTQQTQWHIPSELQLPPPPPPPPLDQHTSTPPPPPPPTKLESPHHLLTPTSGSNHGTEEEEDYLNDIDLKREVGKVVTKYLSSRQQQLWKGDKHLFKDLARKLTHHIVDKETQSGRKIRSMENSLRTKIEKFIDTYGADVCLKMRQTKKP